MKASPVFPPHRLPPGFLTTLQNPPTPPATPRPSATLVPLRGGPAGLEVLLLKRSPRSGFIPGAWVFPGGTVDDEDGQVDVLPGLKLQASSPAPPFWVAALRETFEETGILLHRSTPNPPEPHSVTAARSALLSGQATFSAVLDSLGLCLDPERMIYTAHWVTPECEPRRYETRFFMADVGPDAQADPHELEMVDSVWLTPGQALSRNQSGDLPMVFPTISALEELTAFDDPTEAIAGLRGKTISRCLPVPEQTPAGVRFLLPS